MQIKRAWRAKEVEIHVIFNSGIYNNVTWRDRGLERATFIYREIESEYRYDWVYKLSRL